MRKGRTYIVGLNDIGTVYAYPDTDAAPEVAYFNSKMDAVPLLDPEDQVE